MVPEKLGIPCKRVLDTKLKFGSTPLAGYSVEEPNHTILERHLVFEDAWLRRSSRHNIVEEDATLYGRLRIPIQTRDKAHALHHGEING